MPDTNETKASAAPPAPVPSLGLFALWASLTVFSGLWEVGWQWSKLPGWFYGYALLAGLIGVAASRLPERDRPGRPYLQRIALRGLGWGVPVMAALFSRPLLDGTTAPVQVVIFLAIWTLASLVYGALTLNARTRKWL